MRVALRTACAFALWHAPLAAAAPIAHRPADDTWSLLLPVIAVLLVVGAIAVAIVLGAKRLGYPVSLPGAGRKLRLLERLPLSRHSALLLIEYEGRAVLLAHSPDRLSVIEPHPAPPPADAP